MEVKLIKQALDNRESEEFDMTLQHKSKLCVYKEWKRVVGFEEYFKNLKGPPFGYFLSYVQVPMDFVRSWVGCQEEWDSGMS